MPGVSKGMDFSVVVPFFNEQSHIEECINSLLSQEYPRNKYEIIMVDNNSTDGSAEIVRKYDGINLVQETQQGDFAARNRGIAESRAPIIAFTDADTAPYRDWLKNIATSMAAAEGDVLIGNLKYPPHHLSLAMIAAYESERAEYVFSSDDREIYYGYTCNMAVRKELFERLGGFPAMARNSDAAFVQRVVNAYSCKSVYYAPEVCVRRLEIPNVLSFYRKHYIYGKDLAVYGEVVPLKQLGPIEKFRILRKTAGREHYSFMKSAFLLTLLLVGLGFWQVGRLRKE